MASHLGTNTLMVPSVLSSMRHLWIHLICYFYLILRIKPWKRYRFKAYQVFFCELGYLQTLPSLVAARKRHQLNESASDDIIPDASLINHGERVDYRATDTIEQRQSSSSNSEHKIKTWEPRVIVLDSWTSIYLFELGCSIFHWYGLFYSFTTFYSTSIPLGGLGLDPFMIGITFGTLALSMTWFQAKLLGPLIRKYGAMKIYCVVPWSLRLLYSISSHAVFRPTFG